MAKNLKKMISMIIALVLCFSIIATPASAYGWPGSGFPGWGGNEEEEDLYEWYEVYVQDKLVASGQGAPGNVYYLGTDYKAGVDTDGFMLTWYIRPNGGNAGNFGDTVDMRNYITIPDGYSLDDVVVEESSIGGVNDPYHNQYDNAVIRITVKTLMTEDGEEVEIEEVTEAAVNHYYRTYDVYTGETVLDGSTTAKEGGLVGESYTAIAAPNYNGNTYVQQTDDSALTITLQKDASANVINIEYLRTIDTTPAKTAVTVNHIYKTYDVYTDLTAEDGRTSTTGEVLEREVYTAIAAPDYKGNAYVQQTADSALTITVVADAAANVINIEYLRTIDTTPVETEVTVNHIYKTFDIHTGETVLDGKTSQVESATEHDRYTAIAAPNYNGNAYVQQTADSALTITVVADASANVIHIEYLRTVDTTPIDYNPVVTVTKIADGKGYKAGDTVTWTITVKNIGTDPAYDLVVSDDLTGESWALLSLAPGASHSFTATMENVPAGTLKNVAVVEWDDRDEIPNDEEDLDDEDEEIVEVRELINYTPVLSVEKKASKAVYEAGETITWTITVKNISQHTAQNVTVADELTGDHWVINTLAPGAEQSFSTSLANAQSGSVKNVVVVNWEDGDEIADEAEPAEVRTVSDEETVAINDPIPENYTPVLTLAKVAEKESYMVGDTITWTITVMNAGDYDAYDVVITDELTGDRWEIDVLEAGKQKSFTAKLENAPVGTVKNVAVVDWTDNDEIPDEDEDEIKTSTDEEIVTVEAPPNPAPVLRIVKTSSKYHFEVGETVTWYITVENISEFTAYDVVVRDDLTRDIWVVGTLEPGASRSFAATTETTQAGTITNVAVVTWTDGDETPDAQEVGETKRGSDDALVIVNPRIAGIAPQNDDIVIEDEEVPLAAAPKTGDISGILGIISLVSLGGVFALKGKKEEE